MKASLQKILAIILVLAIIPGFALPAFAEEIPAIAENTPLIEILPTADAALPAAGTELPVTEAEAADETSSDQESPELPAEQESTEEIHAGVPAAESDPASVSEVLSPEPDPAPLPEETIADSDAESLPEAPSAESDPAPLPEEILPETNAAENLDAPAIEPGTEDTAALSAIRLPEELTLEVGEVLHLQPELEPAGVSAQLSYSCNPSNILRFHGNGFIIGVKEGVTLLTVSAANGVSASCTVYVLPAGMQETINYTTVYLPSGAELEVGDTYQIVPDYYPPEANAPLYYESLRPDICEVDANGLVTAKTPGIARINLNFKSGPLQMRTVYMDIHVLSDEHFFDIKDGVLLSYRGPGGEIAIPDGIEEIGSYAFEYKTPQPITAITIPDSVKRIGSGAFAALKQVRRFDLPAGLESIGNYAFSGCWDAEFSELPAGLTYIGNGAFDNCGKAAFSSLPEGLDRIGDYAFTATAISSLRIPASVNSIGSYAFSQCRRLTEIFIPDTVTEIGERAFNECVNLKSVTIPGSVKVIRQYTFANMAALESVILSEGVETLQANAFSGCGSLANVSLPASLTSIHDSLFSSKTILRVPAGSEAWRWCARNGKNFEIIGELSEEDIYVSENGVLKAYYGQESNLVIPDGIVAIAPDAFIPKTITSLTLPEGFTSIPEGAFRDCVRLHTLHLPDSLQEIGSTAFYKCTSLSEFNCPASLQEIGSFAFYNCNGLTEIDLRGGSIKRIGESAFEYCNALSTVRLGDDLESIGRYAFGPSDLINFFVPADSYALSYCIQNNYIYFLHGSAGPDPSFVIHNGVLRKYTGADSHVIIPEGVTEIAENVFKGNASLVSVTFPSTLTTIEDSAFSGCSALETLALPASLDSIGNWAFSNCTALRELKLPGKTFKWEGSSIFQGCTSLESLTLPEGLTSIGSYMFADCSSLKEVKLPSTLNSFGSGVFSNCSALTTINLPESLTYINGSAFRNCTSLRSIHLPESLTVIRTSSFHSCTALEEIHIPDGVTAIESHTFANCTSLRSVRLPASIKSLEQGAFASCSALQSIVLPAKLEEIGRDVFRGCSSLRDLYIPTSVKSISYSVFEGCTSLVVRCEKGSVAEKYCVDNSIRYSTSGENSRLLSFPKGDLTLGVGQSAALELYADEMVGTLSFKSSSSTVSVNADGVITAKKTGSATITATAAFGLKATCKITVKSAPKSVDLVNVIFSLVPGESHKLLVTLPKNSASSLTFVSSNPDVLTVSPEGKVTAIAPGTATITVTTHNGKSDSCSGTVTTPPEAVYLNHTELTIRQTTSAHLKATVNEGSYCHNFKYTSSDTSVARTNGEMVIGVSKGTAVITVTTPNGVSATCTVTVIAPPPRLVLPEALELGVKQTCQLTPEYIFEEGSYSGAYSYSSKSAKIAKVDANGLVTAVKTGSTVITATTEDGISASCTITVKKAPTSIKLNHTSLELGVGEPAQLVPTLSKGSVSPVSYSVSDPAVLDIAPDGAISAKAPGSAAITASTFNGKQATAEITVKPAPTSIAFADGDGTRVQLCEGQTGVFQVVLSEGSGGSYSFESNGGSSLYVNPVTGLFKAHDRDSCTVTVTTYNGLSAKLHVSIDDAPVKLTLPVTVCTLAVGENYQIYPQTDAREPDISIYSYKSSSPKVVTVDESGMLTAKKTGKATITVKTYNGLSAKLTVQVKKPPESISLNTEAIALGVGETFQLATAYYPKNSGAAVTYASSNSSAASVTPDGLIKALNPYGYVTITATTAAGLTDSCVVNLGPAPSYLNLGMNTIDLNVGMKRPVNIDIGDAYCSTFYVGSSNPKVVTFDEYGRIVAKKPGSGTVVIETYNGRRASVLVFVHAAPKKFSLTLPDAVEIGAIYKLCDYVSATPAVDNQNLILSSASVSNDKAMIIENDLGIFLLPLENGTFTLKVKTFSGKTLSKKLNAVKPEEPLLPDAASPARTDVSLADFLGYWKLESVSFAGVSFPPQAAGLGSWHVDVKEGSASAYMENEYIPGTPSVEDGMLALKILGGTLHYSLHENGRLSFLLDEDVCLWFSK